MSSNVRVRFAPSPTGNIHVGNVRPALINWLFARKAGGEFLFRLDDTDDERSKQEYADNIARDLEWLGLTWDSFAKQSDRMDRYELAKQYLIEAGRLYPCYETPDELSLKRKSLLSRGKPPIYDRAALRLTDEDKAAYEAEGRKPHWRFKLEHAPIEWHDLGHGDLRFKGEDLTDPVLFREDGRPIYTISSVVDDLELEVTHVIRGDDHIANTAVQKQLMEALIPHCGGAVPEFAHLPLLVAANGEKLSKRTGALSVADMRADAGIEPMAVLSLLAKLGTSDPIEARATMDQLIEEFDISKFSKATPRFDPEEVKRLTIKLIQDMPFEAVKEKLAGRDGFPEFDQGFWEAVRPNLESLDDITEWHRVANGPVEPVIEDAEFAKQAADLAPDGPWSEATWPEWIGKVKEASGRKGKALFMPLRKALTGMEHGPELQVLLPLIGRDRALARLKGEAS
ncbi:MAG: glutamate--tRNA ligase [Alphaproteobacteria bacterium]|nr:glutamate--tRNA ligase [Alphaproteobacteria bacterium SS10]